MAVADDDEVDERAEGVVTVVVLEESRERFEDGKAIIRPVFRFHFEFYFDAISSPFSAWYAICARWYMLTIYEESDASKKTNGGNNRESRNRHTFLARNTLLEWNAHTHIRNQMMNS